MIDFEFIRDNWLFIATGIGATLGVTIFSFLFATPIAAIVARGRRSSFLPIKALSTFYVLLIDGIPLLLQIFFIFLALPQLGIIFPGLAASLLVMTVNYSARMSEIFYARLVVTEESQGETWTSIIPSFANEFASMIKDSTLLSVTGFIHDVMWRATKVGRAEFKMLEALTIAIIIYLILITIVTLGGKFLKMILSTAKSGKESSI